MLSLTHPLSHTYFSLYGLKLLLCSGLTTLEQSDKVQNLHALDMNLSGDTIGKNK